MRIPNTWSPEERAEHDEALNEAWDSSLVSGERSNRFVEIIEDGVQAHRTWARDVQRRLMHDGAGNALTAHYKRLQSVMVASGATVFAKPRIVGVVRATVSGVKYNTQTLFDLLTVGELREKLAESLKIEKTWSDTAYTYERLVTFCEMYNANTPEEAAQNSGLTVEDWLSGKVAA